jgi:hypothetical protein
MSIAPYLPSLLGGVLIGLSILALFALEGKVAGISGILGNVIRPAGHEGFWSALFVAGMVAGGAVMVRLDPAPFHAGLGRSAETLVLAGLLVGFGTRLGGGCTSGHGVWGVSRLAPRSLAATLVFMGLGVATVAIVRHLLGGHA